MAPTSDTHHWFPARARIATLAVLVFTAGFPGPAQAEIQRIVDGAVEPPITAGTRDRPTLEDPAFLWFSAGRCRGIGEFPGLPDAPARILRIGAAGGSARTLVEVPQVPGHCSPGVYRVLSNLAVDEEHAYFFDTGEPVVAIRLRRIPRSASPETVRYETLDFFLGHDQIDAVVPHEVRLGGPHVYYVHRATQQRTLYRRSKDPAVSDRLQVAHSTVTDIRDLQWDGRYLWFLKGGELWRHDPQSGALLRVATGVDTYLAEFFYEDPWEGIRTNHVQYAKGREMWWADAESMTHDLQYTSPDATARIHAIVRTAVHYFFLESRSIGGPFGERRHLLFRRGVGRAASAAFLHDFGVRSQPVRDLATDRVHLYWVDPLSRSLDRLLASADAIPVVNLRALGLEVVQSIQNARGDVPLVAGKRTFVRFRVQADGQDVRDVGAVLTVTRNGVSHTLQPSLATLPANGDPRPRITVKRQPSRWALGDSFVFELPRHLTTGGPLHLSATVNPGLAKPEPGATPLADNTATRSNVGFVPSPRMDLLLVLLEYRIGSTVYRPAQADVDASLAYLRRTWPLDSSTGSLATAGAGLRIRQMTFRDDVLARRVLRTADECADLLDEEARTDDRNLCAGLYAQALADGLEARGLLPPRSEAPYRYVLIPQTGNPDHFTRGFASGSCVPPRQGGSGVGPVGPGTSETLLTYLAHELGHMVERGHPATGTTCGHNPSDPDYPYPDARIGSGAVPEDERLYALDPGDASIGRPFTLSRHDQRRDLMSYCSGQWISDYTFNRIRACFSTAGLVGRSARGGTAGPTPLSGDWLLAFGWIAPGGAATLSLVQRTSELVALPAADSGPYALQLVGPGGAILASHGFAGEPLPDAQGRSERFGLVVPHVPGTRELRVVRVAAGAAIGGRPLSASPPAVSAVALSGAPDPLQGTVTVQWSASDPDGDPLSFEVLYSSDDGARFEPVRLGVSGTSIAIDTARLAGGRGRFRIVASDGVHTAAADSPPFTMADKAPVPRILRPADGAAFAWGQPIALQGEALDAKDGAVAPEDLAWSNQFGPLGTGVELELAELPVGPNTITLTATNQAGLSRQTSIAITVADELGAAGPVSMVEPASIALHAAAGETAEQTAELRIDNAGGGSLSYTASTDGAAWLRLAGATSGTAPSTLEVIADPAGLEPGRTHAALVRVTPVGQPAAARDVPVTLAVGNVFETGGGAVPEPGATALALAAGAALGVVARRRARRR